MDFNARQRKHLGELNHLAPSADQVEHAIAWLASSEEPDQCIHSIIVLGRSRSERAVLPLFKLIVKYPENAELENTITLALGGFGEPALWPMIEALQRGSENERRKAALVLGSLGDTRALMPLAQALQDPVVGVRAAVVMAACKFPQHEARPLLLVALHDTAPLVRAGAAAELSHPKYRNEQAATALLAAIQDPDADVRSNVIRALGKHRETRAVPALLAAAHDESEWVRTAAVEALGRLQEARAIPLQIRAMHDTSAFVRESAALALTSFGSREALVIALLTCADLSPSDKLDALEALRRLHYKGIEINLDFRFASVVSYCQSLLKAGPSEEVRQAVASIEAEVQARKDQQQLLRGSQSDLLHAKEELLRPHSGVDSTAPEEMLRASDEVPSAPAPPPSWLSRLLERQKRQSP